mmetsp:Transcript_17382/g.44126  ORF Transcript_17382/g.44126 Transcript_17382/m.44126 type:complete len:274 (-) Transcript_17382:1780-2601(-)
MHRVGCHLRYNGHCLGFRGNGWLRRCCHVSSRAGFVFRRSCGTPIVHLICSCRSIRVGGQSSGCGGLRIEGTTPHCRHRGHDNLTVIQMSPFRFTTCAFVIAKVACCPSTVGGAGGPDPNFPTRTRQRGAQRLVCAASRSISPVTCGAGTEYPRIDHLVCSANGYLTFLQVIATRANIPIHTDSVSTEQGRGVCFLDLSVTASDTGTAPEALTAGRRVESLGALRSKAEVVILVAVSRKSCRAFECRCRVEPIRASHSLHAARVLIHSQGAPL